MMRRRYEAYKDVWSARFPRSFLTAGPADRSGRCAGGVHAGPEALHDLERRWRVSRLFRSGRSTFISRCSGRGSTASCSPPTKADHLHHSSHDRSSDF